MENDRLAYTAKKTRAKKRTREAWQHRRMEICQAMFDANLNMSEAARRMYMTPNALLYNVHKMQREGLDPKDLSQLIAALGYVKQEDQP